MEPDFEIFQFEYESATCNLILWGDGTASIGDVYSADRRKGHATNLLKKVITWADDHSLFLKISAEAYGPEPKLPQAQLIEFYRSFGFERTENISREYVYMERPRA